MPSVILVASVNSVNSVKSSRLQRKVWPMKTFSM